MNEEEESETVRFCPGHPESGVRRVSQYGNKNPERGKKRRKAAFFHNSETKGKQKDNKGLLFLP